MYCLACQTTHSYLPAFNEVQDALRALGFHPLPFDMASTTNLDKGSHTDAGALAASRPRKELGFGEGVCTCAGCMRKAPPIREDSRYVDESSQGPNTECLCPTLHGSHCFTACLLTTLPGAKPS